MIALVTPWGVEPRRAPAEPLVTAERLDRSAGRLLRALRGGAVIFATTGRREPPRTAVEFWYHRARGYFFRSAP